jgi:Flp pilus assembly pilin Flp
MKPMELTSAIKIAAMNFLPDFWREEKGQDLIEYTLLMAFVALASAALFLGAGTSIKGIWSSTNTQLAAANAAAGPGRAP